MPHPLLDCTGKSGMYSLLAVNPLAMARVGVDDLFFPFLYRIVLLARVLLPISSQYGV